MYQQGMIKVAAATPAIEVGNIPYNTTVIFRHAQSTIDIDGCFFLSSQLLGIALLTCLSRTIFDCSPSKFKDNFTRNNVSRYLYIRIPLDIYGALYNTAVVCQKVKYLALSEFYIPNHHEFYEKRWFHSGRDHTCQPSSYKSRSTFWDTIIFRT